MVRTARSITLAFASASLLVGGCAPASEPSLSKIAEGSGTTALVANLTGNNKYPAIAFGENGETLVVVGDDLDGTMSGVIWDSPQGDPIVVQTDPDNLPIKLVIGEYVLAYANYTDTTVDITVVSPDGSATAFPGAQLDQRYYRGIRSAQLPSPGAAFDIAFQRGFHLDNEELWHYIKLGSLSLGTAVCVSGVILSAGVTVALSAACAGVLMKAITMEQEQYNKNRITPLESASVSLDAFGCATGSNPADCIDVIIDARDAIHQEADHAISAKEGAADAVNPGEPPPAPTEEAIPAADSCDSANPDPYYCEPTMYVALCYFPEPNRQSCATVGQVSCADAWKFKPLSSYPGDLYQISGAWTWAYADEVTLLSIWDDIYAEASQAPRPENVLLGSPPESLQEVFPQCYPRR